MSFKVKKTSSQETKKLSKLASKDKITENEKENICSRLRLRGKKCVQQPLNALLESSEEKEPKTLLMPLEPAVKVKSLGFWQKKLLDLEENITKKKCELYDFNETDESSSCKRKKIKKKGKPQKKKKQYKPVEVSKPIKVSKTKEGIKEFHGNSLCREQIILGKERKKLAAKGEKFTFSTGIPSLGITSTPAVKKDNLVGASNFLFLSPIIKEEVKCCKRVHQSLPNCDTDSDNDNDALTVNLNQETLTVETKPKRMSCIRVLRSGKMLLT